MQSPFVYLKSAYKISTTNVGYFKSSKNLLRLPLNTGLGEGESLKCCFKFNFRTPGFEEKKEKKKTQISVANTTFKLLERNIELLEVGKDNETLQKLFSLEGCWENSPLVSCSCKCNQSSL